VYGCICSGSTGTSVDRMALSSMMRSRSNRIPHAARHNRGDLTHLVSSYVNTYTEKETGMEVVATGTCAYEEVSCARPAGP
jgi:uncharacterized protein YpmS